MASQRRRRKTHPLLEALSDAEMAIQSKAPPAARVALALAILADAVAKLVEGSDVRSRSVGGGDAEGALLRHGRSQVDRISEIRGLSKEAEVSLREDLPAIRRRARAATTSALRSQVKKLRIRRRTTYDGPGGES